jgi:nitrate/nitrite-specific signal transduction histidine kinase
MTPQETLSNHAQTNADARDASLSLSRLESLLESAQLLHASLDLEDLLRHLLRSVMGRTAAGRALVAVEEDGEMLIKLVRGAPKLKVGTRFDDKQ